MRNDGTRIVQIYCGDGKGKTTAAVGQAVRAAGHGFRVLYIQFLKVVSPEHGEYHAIQYVPNIEFKAFGTGQFLSRETVTDDDYNHASDALNYAIEQFRSQRIDLLVLDELGAVLELGLVSMSKIVTFIMETSGQLDIVVTGRIFPDEVLNCADLITEMKCIRHPFDHSIMARRGIEY